MMQIIYMKI